MSSESESEFDWLTLDDDEEIVWSSRPHRSSIAPALAVGIPLSFVLVGIPIVVGAYLSNENTYYVVTTGGLYRKSGVLSRDVQKVEYDKVQNTSFRQGLFGSYFDYGTIDISTAGGSGVEMQFRGVPEPQRVQSLVNERIRKAGGRGDRDDRDRDKATVLDDILTELRAIRRAVEEDRETETESAFEPADPVEDDEP